MKTRPVVKALSVLLFGLTSAVTAQAGPVITDWNYSLSAVWTAFAPAAPAVTLSGDGKTLSWGGGTAKSSLVITDPADGIVKTQITGDSPQPGTTAAGVTLTHNNFVINPPSLTAATLAVTLVLDAALPLDGDLSGPGGLPSLVYEITFAETPNETPCAAASPPGNPCNDIFVQKTGFLNQVLPWDGNDYFINIFPTTGGLLSTLTDAECTAAGAASGCFGFTTIEGQSNELAFGFTISSQRFGQEVPEPGILALLGIGLAAGALVRRRQV